MSTMKFGPILTTAVVLALLGAAPAQAETATTPTPAPSASASATATPEPTSSATPTPTPTPSATADASEGAGENPSLAEQNAAGNHVMGSTIAAEEGTAKSRSGLSASAALGVGGVLGQDVSGWQPNVDWGAQWAAGSRFAYIKASEGTYYTSSHFPSQYAGALSVGMIRGAYHFATPNTTDGATQARFFYQHGGGWSPDGRTLPPLLDIEYATDGSGTCWGLSTGQMTQWISDFVNTMRALTGVNPAIYSTANWWNTCTGSNTTFGAYPLFVARYGTSTPGALAAGWLDWTIWQYASSGTFAGDQDIFNGTQAQLQQFAFGANVHPPIGTYDAATVTANQPFTLSGWAFDQTSIAAPVQVQITWNTPAGITSTTITANASRPDVGAAYPGVGNNHGFVAQQAWSGYGQYGACVTAIALPGDRAGNAPLGCKTAFVSPVTNGPPPVTRVAGDDRFTTAIAVSKQSFPTPGVPVAYVASGLDFPDALAAAPAAGAQHGPVLLTTPGQVPAGVLAELTRLKPTTIVVVGGAEAISDAAYNQLAGLGSKIVRIGGSDRFETSRLVASYAFPSATSVYAASGMSYPDALSAAPVAAKQGRPLILVYGTSLDQGTRAYLTGKAVKTVTAVGGTTVIPATWASDVQTAGMTVSRIGGTTRFETSSLLVSSAYGSNSSPSLYFASAVAWQDALVAAAAAGSSSQPVLLVKPECVPRTIGDQLIRLGTTSLKIAGGPAAVTTAVDQMAVCY
ncbi:cell wall-binding repeat-containing protein [Leifsonia sp. ZF2019]|uniref:GH25 family lysozyme n=1 Tax=Leifsonia sp. ZF2019 TaxID=2781978 RepID=UPI001CBD4035|nr:GH25 family lysozyme [Leifsonia sp. ZF2019]UAJ80561.1 cell wall-binding repeat-containing protein [Leifsonia sp. ZF2019]